MEVSDYSVIKNGCFLNCPAEIILSIQICPRDGNRDQMWYEEMYHISICMCIYIYMYIDMDMYIYVYCIYAIYRYWFPGFDFDELRALKQGTSCPPAIFGNQIAGPGESPPQAESKSFGATLQRIPADSWEKKQHFEVED